MDGCTKISWSENGIRFRVGVVVGYIVRKVIPGDVGYNRNAATEGFSLP